MPAFESSVEVHGATHRTRFGNGQVPVAADLVGLLPSGINNGDIIDNRSPAHSGAPLAFRYISGVSGVTAAHEEIYPTLMARLDITNAQILALNTTPLQVIAAPGAGNLIEIVSMVLENVYSTAAFAAGGTITLGYGATASPAAAATVAATFLTSPTANQVIMAAGALATNLGSDTINKPIYITNASANFTTGAGSIKLRVAYRIHGGLS